MGASSRRRRPCRKHDARPVPPVERHVVVGLPPPRQKFPAGTRAIPLEETDADAQALRRTREDEGWIAIGRGAECRA
jgi:hypothetical protein